MPDLLLVDLHTLYLGPFRRSSETSSHDDMLCLDRPLFFTRSVQLDRPLVRVRILLAPNDRTSRPVFEVEGVSIRLEPIGVLRRRGVRRPARRQAEVRQLVCLRPSDPENGKSSPRTGPVGAVQAEHGVSRPPAVPDPPVPLHEKITHSQSLKARCHQKST